MMKQLESTKADSLKKHIEFIWDITQHYWYPLYKCKRNDVLAFNDDYINKNEEKITDVRNILLKLNYNSVYEMNEDRLIWLIDTNSLVPTMSKYNDERFWFSEDMSWIIYVSHEGSITLGGEELLNQVKAKWDDWQSNIFVTEYE
ncbi:MAG: hypothetical protein WBF39_03525 [Planococcus donghaensis]